MRMRNLRCGMRRRGRVGNAVDGRVWTRRTLFSSPFLMSGLSPLSRLQRFLPAKREMEEKRGTVSKRERKDRRQFRILAAWRQALCWTAGTCPRCREVNRGMGMMWPARGDGGRIHVFRQASVGNAPFFFFPLFLSLSSARVGLPEAPKIYRHTIRPRAPINPQKLRLLRRNMS